jgi:hypothetical protein
VNIAHSVVNYSDHSFIKIAGSQVTGHKENI